MLTSPQDNVLTQVFAETTVDLAGVEKYLFGLPSYARAGAQMSIDQFTLYMLIYTDGFEFWLKRYLFGKPKTLHRLFHEIRTFQSFNHDSALVMIEFSLNAVQRAILLNEWYELMPRYQLARRRIRKQFGIG